MNGGLNVNEPMTHGLKIATHATWRNLGNIALSEKIQT